MARLLILNPPARGSILGRLARFVPEGLGNGEEEEEGKEGDGEIVVDFREAGVEGGAG